MVVDEEDRVESVEEADARVEELVLVAVVVVEALEEVVVEVELIVVVVLLDDVVVVVTGASKTYVAASVELADNFRILVGDVTPSPHLENPK